MSVNGAVTFVTQVYVFNLSFFPPATMTRWQGQARLRVPGAMGSITNAKALVTPAPGEYTDLPGGETRDAILLYLGIKK